MLLLSPRRHRQTWFRKLKLAIGASSDSGGTATGGSNVDSRHGADGLIAESEIEICKRPDGTDWLLGQGGFGKARTVFRTMFRTIFRTAAALHPASGADPES